MSFCLNKRHKIAYVLISCLCVCAYDRIVKIPDVHGTLPFVLCGSCPPYVHAVKKGESSLFVMVKTSIHIISRSYAKWLWPQNPEPFWFFSIKIHMCYSKSGNALPAWQMLMYYKKLSNKANSWHQAAVVMWWTSGALQHLNPNSWSLHMFLDLKSAL